MKYFDDNTVKNSKDNWKHVNNRTTGFLDGKNVFFLKEDQKNYF